ncbi:MAG: hypothetical protein MZW92_62055 [Comamonadaceae bacterium]|nr:hypothetical protein [Comamonadaceae bacterium]
MLRGPQGLLYGSDALGGVVNIITRTGRGRPRLRAGARRPTRSALSARTSRSPARAEDRITRFALFHERTAGLSAASSGLRGQRREGRLPEPEPGRPVRLRPRGPSTA